MILERKHFDLNNQTVIEKLIIQTPFNFRTTLNDEACFLFIKKGEMIIHAPTEQQKVVTFESIVMNCGTYLAHVIQSVNQSTCEIIAVHLPKIVLMDLYKDEIPPFIKSHSSSSYTQKIQQSVIIQPFIESIEFYFQHPNLVQEELLKLKIKELILLLLQTQNGGSILELVSQLFTPKKTDFKEVVQSYLYKPISVSSLATLSGYSLSSFKRAFETYYQTTPASYIKSKKLLKAKELLLNADYTIAEIVFEVGFQDASHFTKLFKQAFQMTPTAFKKAHK